MYSVLNYIRLHIEREGERENEGRENGGKRSELTHIERWGKQRQKERKRQTETEKGTNRDREREGDWTYQY